MSLKRWSIGPVVAALLLSAAPAWAFNPFGIFGPDPDEIAVIGDPQNYDLTVTTNAEGSLENAIRRASQLVGEEGTPASGASGLLARARGDYRRIVAALYGEGYYGGVVSILINGREASSIPPDARLPNPAAVAIRVDTGPQFRFSRLAIANQAPPTADPDDFVEPPTTVGFASGEIARSSVVARTEALAIEAWRQLGYPQAQIASRDVVADHNSRTVDVLVSVDPGRPARFGPIAVQGAQTLNPDFLVRQTGIEVGEEFDPDTLERAQSRLDRLEVFRSARLDAAQQISPSGLLPYTLIVDELPGRRFGAGASFSTVDGVGLEAYHLWRNLFGEAERLRIDARIARLNADFDPERFDYFAGATFTNPGVITPDTDLVASVSAERTVVPTYIETSAQARLGLSHLVFDDLVVEGGAQVEIARFEDALGERDFTTAGVYGVVTYDGRDNPLDATEGFYAMANVEPFYEFNFGNAAVRAILEGRTYFGLGDDNQVVLAARVRTGAILGPDDINQIPPDRLFFAGGGGSVRGYEFRSIGIDGPTGVTGGSFLIEGSLEARVRVTGDIGVVAFVDAGTVSADPFAGVEEVRFGAGLGVRYDTGFGPLRLDIAVPVNRRDFDPDFAIYAGIGQAF